MIHENLKSDSNEMPDKSSRAPEGAQTDDNRLESTIFEPERIRSMRVVVAGLGALGNELVKTLGMLGVGEVLLVDPDRIEAGNRTRSVFYQDPALTGRPKAEVLEEMGRRWFPATRWESIAAEIADVGWGRLRGRNLIFAGVDRDSARVEMARISTRMALPVCDGGLSTSNYSAGRVSWFPGTAGGCWCCRLGEQRRREILSTWRSQAHSCNLPAESGGWPSTPAMASITAALEVELGFRWLFREERQALSVDVTLDPGPKLEMIRVPRSPECPFHDESGGHMWSECNGTFAEILAEGKSAYWEWPICLRARCQDCGKHWAPMLRTVRLRREGCCPACGSRNLLELESVRGVGRGTPLARKRPEEIGLPPDHLYSIREDRMGRETK